MMVVGLTGNYGMGKSTAARMFRELGAITIDTDDIVGKLLQDSPVIYEVKKMFGDDIAEDSSINRQKLAAVVFQNPHLRIALENILHPKVFKKIDEELDKISRSSPAIIIVEAPILFERGYQNRFDKIITVFTPEEVALARLKEKGVPEDKALERLKSQFPSEMKAGKSDFTIDNTKDAENTRKQVEEIYRALLSIEGGQRNN
ncbi:MAG: dephospho-CoA kinase [Nitrospirae bacterium]|nr:dephospho-CoA kinase [Nitrospirota bacterium]